MNTLLDEPRLAAGEDVRVTGDTLSVELLLSMTLDTQSRCALPAKGYWFPPTILTDVTHAHRVAQEKIFGLLS
jgi:hypothetical protein